MAYEDDQSIFVHQDFFQLKTYRRMLTREYDVFVEDLLPLVEKVAAAELDPRGDNWFSDVATLPGGQTLTVYRGAGSYDVLGADADLELVQCTSSDICRERPYTSLHHDPALSYELWRTVKLLQDIQHGLNVREMLVGRTLFAPKAALLVYLVKI